MNLNVLNVSYKNVQSTSNKKQKNKTEYPKTHTRLNKETKSFSSSLCHPLMFTPNISFKGTVDRAGLDAKSFTIVNNALNKCSYGKKNLFCQNKEYSFDIDDENMYFKGFYPKDEDGEYTGICQELAVKVKKDLDKKLKDKFLVLPVSGSVKDYGFNIHCFLVLLKDTPKNRLKAEKLKERSAEGERLMKEFIPKLQTGEFSAEELNEVNAQCDEYCVHPEDVTDGVLVDPSFQRIIKISDNKFPEGYTIHKCGDMEEAVDSGDMVISRGTPLDTPLGFVKDIAPEMVKNKNFLDGTISSDDMVALTVRDYGFMIDPAVMVVDKNGANREVLNIDELGENHPLFDFFMEHLKM